MDVLPIEEAGRIATVTKKPEDGKGVLRGPAEVDRRYAGEAVEVLSDLGSMTREERAEKYARDMKPHADAQLEEARGDLVRKYRAKPQAWPDGIDSKWNRWYRAQEWNDLGEYIGQEPCVRAANPDATNPESLLLPVERITGEEALRRFPDPKRVGCPPVGDAPMTATDRSRALRAKRKGKTDVR